MPGKYFLILLSAILFASCHKSSTTNYAKMNGTWIGIGTCNDNLPDPAGAFLQINVTVINDKKIVVNYDTMLWQSGNTFKKDYSYGSVIRYRELAYDNRSISYWEEFNSSVGGGISFSVSTDLYQPNRQLKEYTPKIEGIKTFSVTYYDTIPFRRDSISNFTTTATLTAVNDSTLAFSCGSMQWNDTLHYKSTDDAAKTVTFQDFHAGGGALTLNYNFETNVTALDFETFNQPEVEHIIFH